MAKVYTQSRKQRRAYTKGKPGRVAAVNKYYLTFRNGVNAHNRRVHGRNLGATN